MATPAAGTTQLSPEVQPALAPDVAQALQAYQAAVDAYEATRRQDWRRAPAAPEVLLYPLWRKVEAARQRLAGLGINPDTLTAFAMEIPL